MKKINECFEKKSYREKVLQFGEGNFMCAFVDWMIAEMNKAGYFNGSAVVIQPIEKGRVKILNEQDGLFTLYLNGIKNGEVISEHTIISSISRGINTYSDYNEFLKAAENPQLRFITSNTTEAGIVYEEKDRLEDRPQSSFPGKLTAFLYHRYQFFNGDMEKGFIFLPCELIDKNGEKLKETIVKLAKLWNLEEGFVEWINEANTFCNTLVDRIVPGYPKDKIEEITKELGYEDKLVVEGEQFHLWVIEGPQWVKDEFPADKAGLNVLFVDDLTPYRTRKVRILNGAHTAMVPVSYLYGKDTVKEAIDDPVVGKFIQDAIYDEIIPTLELSEKELQDFAQAVMDRFKNPFIKHYLMSISLNGMSKFKTRVLPSILQYQESNNSLPNRLVFSLAALIAFYRGERDGVRIDLKDDEDILELYQNLWASYDGTRQSLEQIVEAVLGYEKNWEMDLNKIDGLHQQVTDYLEMLLDKGMQEAVQTF
ncbi:tagaturonate reductase [Natronincola peptidivorans]|uniref:Altronate oxidoreductase n=1 Tax=Natronincola peptidivorans TaxID=426128 RepID=A0A1I0DZP9_9FIRM|nr:tagaturonate reductase [Natronincola peptidivorans]SET38246.1 tagaturonate reductase [Natronincola peptidivorans]